MSDLLNIDMANVITYSTSFEVGELLQNVIRCTKALEKAKKALDDKVAEIEKGMTDDTVQ